MRPRAVFKYATRMIATVVFTIAGLIAFPDPLFAFTSTNGRITVLSDHPIDAAGARAVASDIEARLARSPLSIAGGAYKLVVTNEDWRRRILFAHMYNTGGVAFYPLSRNHVFLSGANFAQDRLLRPNGTAVAPPRTLGYYGAHEIAHVLTGERVGALRFLIMPRWIIEGLADYCALGAPPGDLRAFDAELGREPITLPQMNRYGVYPRARMLVAHMLGERKWTLDQLLASDLTEDDALALLRSGAR